MKSHNRSEQQHHRLLAKASRSLHKLRGGLAGRFMFGKGKPPSKGGPPLDASHRSQLVFDLTLDYYIDNMVRTMYSDASTKFYTEVEQPTKQTMSSTQIALLCWSTISKEYQQLLLPFLYLHPIVSGSLSMDRLAAQFSKYPQLVSHVKELVCLKSASIPFANSPTFIGLINLTTLTLDSLPLAMAFKWIEMPALMNLTFARCHLAAIAIPSTAQAPLLDNLTIVDIADSVLIWRVRTPWDQLMQEITSHASKLQSLTIPEAAYQSLVSYDDWLQRFSSLRQLAIRYTHGIHRAADHTWLSCDEIPTNLEALRVSISGDTAVPVLDVFVVFTTESARMALAAGSLQCSMKERTSLQRGGSEPFWQEVESTLLGTEEVNGMHEVEWSADCHVRDPNADSELQVLLSQLALCHQYFGLVVVKYE